MGHSRGGDAVTSFIDYNRTRPAPGPQYNLRGVIALAPIDYERRAPYGVPYMTMFGYCDGDVSNLQGARMFERSQYIEPGDPFPRIQVVAARRQPQLVQLRLVRRRRRRHRHRHRLRHAASPNNIRLSGGTYDARPTRGSGDPGADGRPGEGRPRDDVLVLPPLRRRRRRRSTRT